MLFQKTYGIDLGSSDVKIYSSLRNNTYSEKNMIAARGHEIIAVGDDAYEMSEKEPVSISVQSPMAFGDIAEVELQEIVIYTLLKKIDYTAGIPSAFYFSVPLDMTAIERRAYYYVVNGHWLHQNRVFMVESPVADALAIGMDPESSTGGMIVNIGGQCTDLSVLTDGKIIMSRKILVGGQQMDEAISSEIRRRHHLQIGLRTARRLKLVMGRLSDSRKDARKVVGIDSVSGLPREEVITSYEVNAGIMNCVNEIAAEMKTFLERVPPQISYQIAREGIHLTGGSTRLPFIDRYLASATGYGFNLSSLYENCTLSGLTRVIREKELRKWARPVVLRKL